MRTVLGRGRATNGGKFEVDSVGYVKVDFEPRMDFALRVELVKSQWLRFMPARLPSPRGTKVRNRRLPVFVRDPTYLGCCGARSQLLDARKIVFPIVRTAEIRSQVGFR